MEFVPNEEQDMLKTMARDFLEKECPKTLVRELMEDDCGHSAELWKKMAEVGWLGLTIPEEYGGAGMTFRDLTVLCEEMGRAMMPGPFLSSLILAGMPILDAGSDELKQEMLPKLCSGEAVFTAAVAEEDGDFWAEGVQMRAIRQGNEYVLDGSKLFVADAKAADYILVAARTSRGGAPEDGITLFLVDASEWGIYVAPLQTMDQTRKQYELILTRVAVPDKYIIGEVGKGWQILEKAAMRMTAALCADAVGGSEWVLDTTVNYVKDRVQFGVAIGSFQAIKHKCADMYSALEYSRSLMEWAAEAVREENDNAAVATAMAKSYCGDAYKLITDHGVQCHGGIGFTWDHDMHLYFKRARSFDAAFGDSTYQRELIAQSFD